MKARENEALAAFRRCQKLTARYLADLGGDNASARSVLDDVVDKMEQLAGQQREALQAARAETRRQNILALVIRRNHLHPLITVMQSRGMSEGILRSARRHMKRRDLILACRVAEERAQEVKERLVRAGLPPGFLTEMVRSARALEESLDARSRYIGTAVGATAGLLMHIRRGRHALNGLEALLTIRYATEPRVLVEWRHARRMKHRRTAPDDASDPTGGETA